MESNFIDWHPADIIAGLRKKGTSMAAESRRNGLSSSTLANALSRPWPKGEMIIAKALGTDPWVIWPSRYHDPQTHEFIDRTQLMIMTVFIAFLLKMSAKANLVVTLWMS